MRAYFNMPSHEFTAQLRDIAIKANARPQVIDAIDALDTTDMQAENAELAEKAGELENSLDKLAYNVIAFLGQLERPLTSAARGDLACVLGNLVAEGYLTEREAQATKDELK